MLAINPGRKRKLTLEDLSDRKMKKLKKKLSLSEISVCSLDRCY
jgi:hypothetical protein